MTINTRISDICEAFMYGDVDKFKEILPYIKLNKYYLTRMLKTLTKTSKHQEQATMMTMVEKKL
jgi:hypothetical protein